MLEREQRPKRYIMGAYAYTRYSLVEGRLELNPLGYIHTIGIGIWKIV